jgi:FkbM family methyltransferase
MAAALRHVRSRLIVAERDRPSTALIDDVFAYRLATLPARVRARTATDRESQLMAVSSAYTVAVGSAAAPVAHATRIASSGLTWWIPRHDPTAAKPSGNTFRLPFRGIVQTRELTRGGIMLDIGANIGRMAIPRVVLGDVLVAYCAEPAPDTYACLARNVLDNDLRGLVLPDQTAIGDRNGTVALLRAGSSENFRVLNSPAARASTIEVPCCTLDTWVARLAIDLEAVTFVKVDVEGFERRLIAGASRVLAQPHIAWQMEIKPAGLRAAGDDPGELFRDLEHAFTHFMDLNRKAVGPLIRPVAELGAALAYLEPSGKTDILLFSAARAAAL